MADATQATATDSPHDGMVLSPHVRMDRAAIWSETDKTSNKPTDPVSRVERATLVAQIPADVTGVYDDTRPSRADSTQNNRAESADSLLAGLASPGKWTSVLATVLLFGFLFWRRAS